MKIISKVSNLKIEKFLINSFYKNNYFAKSLNPGDHWINIQKNISKEVSHDSLATWNFLAWHHVGNVNDLTNIKSLYYFTKFTMKCCQRISKYFKNCYFDEKNSTDVILLGK